MLLSDGAAPVQGGGEAEPKHERLLAAAGDQRHPVGQNTVGAAERGGPRAVLLLLFLCSIFYSIFTVDVAVDQVQGGWEEGGVQLPLLQAAGDPGDPSRQGGVSAAESGDL